MGTRLRISPMGRIQPFLEATGSFQGSQAGLRSSAVLITLTIIIIALLIDVVVSRGHKGAALTKGTQPDASVFISTLILLYTVFMAVYGTLLPIVIARKLGAWEKRALTLMGSAVLLNLYRIGNSLGDLYTTTMGRLTPGQIHDASYEFIYYYFPINIVAIVVALGVCLRGWGRGSRKLSADQPADDRSFRSAQDGTVSNGWRGPAEPQTATVPGIITASCMGKGRPVSRWTVRCRNVSGLL